MEGNGVVVCEVYVSCCFLFWGMEDLVQVQHIVALVFIASVGVEMLILYCKPSYVSVVLCC